MKKVLIIGASGFIGTAITKNLKDSEIHSLRGRSIRNLSTKELSEKISGYDVLINLAGRKILSRWTASNKKQILDSRVLTTNKIVQAVNRTENPPKHFINASAIGIYKPETRVKESDKEYNTGFVSQVVSEWESSLEQLEPGKTKLTIMRIGVVLGKDGGAYKTLRTLVKLNLGAYFDGGRQSLSFIWIKDFVKAVEWIIEKEITGIVNMVSPETSNYKELMLTMKKELKAFIIWPLPSVLLAVVFGKARRVLLDGHIIIPSVLLENNFNFEAENITTCIKKLESN